MTKILCPSKFKRQNLNLYQFTLISLLKIDKMAEVVRMPRMSDTMTEGVIVEWHKKVGDKVKPGDLLAEVETDKATMELESYNEGTLLYIGVEKGKSIAVEGVLAVVGKEGEDYKAALNPEPSTEKSNSMNAIPPAEPKLPTVKESTQAPDQGLKTEASTVQAELSKDAKAIRMPLLSDTMTEGKIIQWNKKVGDVVKSDDVLAEVETDKATMEVVGYEEGTLLHIGIEAGKAARVNQVIAIIGKAGTDVSAFIAAEEKNNSTTPQEHGKIKDPGTPPPQVVTQPETAITNGLSDHNSGDGRKKASPLAKKMAAEKGIDIGSVNGSGDGGRIIKKDIDAFVPAKQVGSNVVQKAQAPQNVQPFTAAGQEGYTDIPLTQMRKTIARRLTDSNFTSPHFFLTMEVNMDLAIQSRSSMNEISPVKISFNDLIIKSCAMALRQHPPVNSSWMGEFIRQNQHIHIGSAIALPEGLIVPVIRFADQKSLSQIAADAKDLYDKARNKKLQPQEFSGNTFTISNLGMLDIDEFTAIINPPDSAILAVGRIKEVVVKKGEGFGISNLMKLTLSCDHRSVDGAVGAAFLQTVKRFLENPVTMLI